MTRTPQVVRHLRPGVLDALADTRVVAVIGPRQAGKSTLVRDIVAGRADATYVTLDDAEPRAAAAADPAGFIETRGGMFAIDEVGPTGSRPADLTQGCR